MRECHPELSVLLNWNRGKLIAAALKSLICSVLLKLNNDKNTACFVEVADGDHCQL